MLYKQPFGLNKDIKHPKGKNDLRTDAAYYYRQFYKNVTYPSDIFPPPIDFWYDVPLYGKIDRQGTAVFVSETNLKQIAATNRETHYAVDFVADAFKDLKGHFALAGFKRDIEIETDKSQLIELNPRAGWRDLNKEYDRYLNAVYRLFSSSIANSFMNKQIKDFKTFMDITQNILLEMAKKAPITRTGFLISGHTAPNVSGLVIEVANKDYTRDMKKLEFIEDPNFEFYRSAAKNFGFLVDKNAPWRLVADLHSPKMRQYMQQYGLTFNTLFESYYYKSYLHDIEALKNYMLIYYDSFVESYPTATEARAATNKDCQTATKVIRRMPIVNFSNVAAFSKTWNIDDLYWLKFYLRLRVQETGANWDKVRFDKVFDKARTYYLGLDISTALAYINDTLTNHQNDDKLAKLVYTGVSDAPTVQEVTEVAATSSNMKFPVATVPWHINPKLRSVVKGETVVPNISSGFAEMAKKIGAIQDSSKDTQ